ncbi:MAG: sporulation protein YunB [Oscillospiraceae bacterium]
MKHQLYRGACWFVSLGLLCIVVLQWKVRPVLVALADTRVSNVVTESIDASVLKELSEESVFYEDLIQFEKDESGNITAMKSNMTGLTRVRYRLVSRLLADLADLTSAKISIPLGNLTKNAFLSGWGPAIPVHVLSIGTVKSGFDNSFRSTGINQTIHSVLFHITVEVRILIPGGVISTTVESTVNIAETVIVGTVPDSYTYFSQFDNVKEASESYFDYGAQLEQ